MKKANKEEKKQHNNKEKTPNYLVQTIQGLSPESKKWIGVIFLFTLGLLSLFSLLGLAGSFGNWFSSFLGMLFGSLKFVIVIFTIVLGFSLLQQDKYPIKNTTWLGIFFFILAVTGLFHIKFDPQDSLAAALAGSGGGLAGFFLAYSLQKVLGFWGCLVILLALLGCSCVIIFNTSLSTLKQNPQFLDFFNKISSIFSSWFHKDNDKLTAEQLQQEVLASIPAFAKKEIEIEKDEKEGQKNQEEGSQDVIDETAKTEEVEILKPKKAKYKIQLSLELLNKNHYQPVSGDIKTGKAVIARTFENFGISVEMGEVNVGPTVTQYTLKPAQGVKLASIIGLHNDLALSLAAHPIRIEAPIPGKSLVGIEVPNQKIAVVSLRELLESEPFKKRKNNMSICLGKDVSGVTHVASIVNMPHMLIAGATGSGKTVCINTIIINLLFQNNPEDLRFIMIDPKRVELNGYNGIPHLLTPVITDVKKTVNTLKWAIGEMERRFETLARKGRREIVSYNRDNPDDKLPYIVIIIDELADIMVTAGNVVESLIIRLAQMARAVGIHLILATQRPSTDVITGLIKANVPTRIAFSVASQIDSRTILDTPGAEKLVGKGDMLYLSAELAKPKRIQGVYVTDEEIEAVVEELKKYGEPEYQETVMQAVEGRSSDGQMMGADEDDLLPEAKDIVVQAKKASASLLQRRLRVGYARAARLLDLLENQGIVGPADGAKPREVYVNDDGGQNFDDSPDSLEAAEMIENNNEIR